MKNWEDEFRCLLKQASFDYLSLAFIDFSSKSKKSLHFKFGKEVESGPFFDLASLTKPITLGTTYLEHESLFIDDILLLSEHRGGLNPWGLLHKESWDKQLFSYKVQESKTIYSDFSAIRCQLELEKSLGFSLKEIVSKYSNESFIHHLELTNQLCASTGNRLGDPICGDVHDPNAFNLAVFLSHAGYFSTSEGLADFLLSLDLNLAFIKKMKSIYPAKKDRFLRSWDTPVGIDSLAGSNWSEMTIGHLGFTGTSMWIDLKEQTGLVFLTNATQHFWHDREILNQLRRLAGSNSFNMS